MDHSRKQTCRNRGLGWERCKKAAVLRPNSLYFYRSENCKTAVSRSFERVFVLAHEWPCRGLRQPELFVYASASFRFSLAIGNSARSTTISASGNSTGSARLAQHLPYFSETSRRARKYPIDCGLFFGFRLECAPWWIRISACPVLSWAPWSG